MSKIYIMLIFLLAILLGCAIADISSYKNIVIQRDGDIVEKQKEIDTLKKKLNELKVRNIIQEWVSTP